MARQTIKRLKKNNRKSRIRRNKRKKCGGAIDNDIVNKKDSSFTTYADVTLNEKTYVIEKMINTVKGMIRVQFIKEYNQMPPINEIGPFVNNFNDNPPKILKSGGTLAQRGWLIPKKPVIPNAGYDPVAIRKNALRDAFWRTITNNRDTV
jgi:hypothetical protein